MEKDNEKLKILIGLKKQYIFFFCSKNNNIYIAELHTAGLFLKIYILITLWWQFVIAVSAKGKPKI